MENTYSQKFKLEYNNCLKPTEVQLLPGPFIFDICGLFTKEIYNELLKCESESESELILAQLLINMSSTI